ncbi:Pre-mRNA-splicing factor CWC25 -like protein [Trichinella nelsoni]|uniref:Pre-mRNA-splicing factor CWC25-like protein n=1 Tax=Trichinella nelsoni TaxID=6336 RepID=A0A0V0RUJ3_9BILA|nr:Pre-mRNA-splicing factor CWC25 -like protein [Trichinella nelsoni]
MMDWMYGSASSLLDREAYLTGRKIDKNFELFNEDFKEPATKLETICEGRSTQTDACGAYRPIIGIDTIRKEDPLVAIKSQEERIRREILDNPVKMKRLKKIVMKAMRKKMCKLLSKKLSEAEKKQWMNFFSILDGFADNASSSRKQEKQVARSVWIAVHEISSGCESDDEQLGSRRKVGKPLGLSYVSEASKHTRLNRHNVPSSSSSRSTLPEYSKRKSEKEKKKKKLDENEREKRLAAMQQNAQWRSEQRSRNLAKMDMREKEEEDKNKRYSSKGGGFVRPMLISATENVTVESRIKSKRQTIQRSSNAMSENFAKR